MSVRKKFDKELFAAFDLQAREKTKEYLVSLGYEVKDNPNKYAQDLIASKDGKQFFAECEVKLVWKDEEFPYETIQLPERKKKFFTSRTLFFIWNKKLDNAIYFWSDHIKDLTPVEVPNKYVYKGEYFYQIPLDMTKRVSCCKKDVGE